jgi:uncharacterized delta-60 repeat protein
MKNIYILFLSVNVFSQAGSFDPTFETDGKTTYCFLQNEYHAAIDSDFQSNGKIIYYGVNALSCGVDLVRFNTNGSLDTTFGTNGIIVNSICGAFPNGGYYPQKMTIQSDDKILIMGLQQNNTYPNGYWIARLTANGALDTTFNGTGYKDLSFGTLQDRGLCIALQTDGKILVGGTSGSTAEFFTVARLTNTGALDTTFGIGGKAQVTFSGNQSMANSIVVQPDGKIVLGGYTANAPFGLDFALARFLSNGSLDTSFGVNGKVITTVDSNYSDAVTQLAIQSDGKIVAAGFTSFETNTKMAVVRYLSNGNIDINFGINGINVITDGFGGKNCSVAVQTDNKIIVAGGWEGGYFEVFRLLNNGTLDTAFGSNGLVNAFPVTGGYASKVLIQPDNKIVVTGSTPTSDFSSSCATVIRLNAGTLSTESFTSNLISLFPNPTTGVVNFDNSVNKYDSVGIYNYLGQEVRKQELNIMGNEVINLSSLSNGIYLLKFVKDSESVVVKVVKE